MEQKRIVIVNDGIFKSKNLDHYKPYVDSLKEMAERVKMRDGKGKETDRPVAIVSVVESTGEAKDLALAIKVDMVIFVSADMYKDALAL